VSEAGSDVGLDLCLELRLDTYRLVWVLKDDVISAKDRRDNDL
jgi:hypothetical protein